MALQQRLQTRLSQKLILTPSLQQAIKLLQLSQLELVDVVSQELQENPVLDVEESGDEELPAEVKTEREAPDTAASSSRPAAGRARQAPPWRPRPPVRPPSPRPSWTPAPRRWCAAHMWGHPARR